MNKEIRNIIFNLNEGSYLPRIKLKNNLFSKFLFLWTGSFDGDNLLSNLSSDVITVTDKDFATNKIPSTT